MYSVCLSTKTGNNPTRIIKINIIRTDTVSHKSYSFEWLAYDELLVYVAAYIYSSYRENYSVPPAATAQAAL